MSSLSVLKRIKVFIKTINSAVITLFSITRVLLFLALFIFRFALLRARARIWLFRSRRKFMETMRSRGVPYSLAKELVEIYSTSNKRVINKFLYPNYRKAKQ